MKGEDEKAAERLKYLGIMAYTLFKSGKLDKIIDEVKNNKDGL